MEIDGNFSRKDVETLLKKVLVESYYISRKGTPKRILMSSDQKIQRFREHVGVLSFPLRFMHQRWDIGPSELKMHTTLFNSIVDTCQEIFQYYLNKGEIRISKEDREYSFEVTKFDEIRGSLILQFKPIPV